jgi:hypothetical protein
MLGDATRSRVKILYMTRYCFIGIVTTDTGSAYTVPASKHPTQNDDEY